MYVYLGGTINDNRSEEFDGAFKAEKSNLCIVIVVDMWIVTSEWLTTCKQKYGCDKIQRYI